MADRWSLDRCEVMTSFRLSEAGRYAVRWREPFVRGEIEPADDAELDTRRLGRLRTFHSASSDPMRLPTSMFQAHRHKSHAASVTHCFRRVNALCIHGFPSASRTRPLEFPFRR